MITIVSVLLHTSSDWKLKEVLLTVNQLTVSITSFSFRSDEVCKNTETIVTVTNLNSFTALLSIYNTKNQKSLVVWVGET